MVWRNNHVAAVVLWTLAACGASLATASTAVAQDAAATEQRAAQLYRDGRYAEAVRAGEEAVQSREQTLGSDHLATAQSAHTLIRAYCAAGQYAKALPLAERTLSVREKAFGATHPDTAESLHDLAEVYSRVGDYAKALPLAERALDVRTHALGPEHAATAESLNDLGALYMEMRNYQDALRHYQRALEIREKVLGPDDPSTAESLGNIAAAYVTLKDYQHALPLFERALAIKERTLGREHPETANTLANLAELYRRTHDYAKAVPLLQRVLAIKQKTVGPEHPETAKALNNLAGFYWSTGEYGRKQALDMLQQAEAIWEKTVGSEHPDTVAAINRLAAFYRGVGDYPKALALYRRGLSIEDRNLASVFEVTSEDEKLEYVDRTQGHYLAALSLITSHFATDPSAVRFGLEVVLRRKGILLDAQSRMQEALAGHLSPEVLKAWQRLTALRNDHAKLLVSGFGEQSPDQYRQQLDSLRENITREEQFLSEHSALVARELAQRQVTTDMLAQRLPADGMLVEFVVVGDWDEKALSWTNTSRYVAFILTADDRVSLVDLGAVDATDAQIDSTLSAINDPGFIKDVTAYTHRTDSELSGLYKQVFAPIDTASRTTGPLIVSPDGQLHRVPFAALQTPGGRYLIEERPVSYVASGRDLLRDESAIKPTLSLVLAANPAFDDRQVLSPAVTRSHAAVRAADYEAEFRPLPGTAEEARAITPLVHGQKTLLLGKDATESAVRAVKSPKILHLATHGFFLKDRPEDQMLPDPLSRSGGAMFRGGAAGVMVRSGLALAGANHANEIKDGDDGILTALEVSGMDLYGTDLVVLTACDTALGEIKVREGVYGLRRAFVLAGARNLIMSLWEVNDKFTRDLIERFYQEYEQNGSVPLALRDAELGTIAQLRQATQASKQGEALAPVNLWAPLIVQQTGEPPRPVRHAGP